jgi:hypothetical protein
LYRKQYFTPTIILNQLQLLNFVWTPDAFREKITQIQEAYHRFVKTTPKPSATKNKRGELVAFVPPEPSPLLPVVVAELLEDEVVEGAISTC